jgi:hypothetical protein
VRAERVVTVVDGSLLREQVAVCDDFLRDLEPVWFGGSTEILRVEHCVALTVNLTVDCILYVYVGAKAR